jgi:hypothetical protein
MDSERQWHLDDEDEGVFGGDNTEDTADDEFEDADEEMEDDEEEFDEDE